MKVADTTGSDAAGGIQIVGGYAEAGAAGMVGIGGGISQSGAGGTVTVQGGNGGADGGYVNINGGAGGANGGSIVLTASSGSSSNGYVALKAVNTEISVHENGELRLGNNVSDYMSQVYKHLIILPNDGSAVEVADLGYDKSVYQGVEISYSMASILGARVGTILITTDGSETSIADSYTETADLGVVFSAVVDGSDVVVSVDNDGQETDMRALIKKFQAVAFPTPAPTGTQLGTFASYDGSNLLAINLPSDPGGLKFIVWDIAAGAYLGGSWQVMTYGGTSFLVGTLGGYGYSLVAGKTYLGVFWDSSDVVVGVTDQFTI
jgi:hypothetical protein